MSDNYFDLPSRIEDAFAEIDSDIVMDLLNTDEDYAVLSDRMGPQICSATRHGSNDPGSGSLADYHATCQCAAGTYHQ